MPSEIVEVTLSLLCVSEVWSRGSQSGLKGWVREIWTRAFIHRKWPPGYL